MITWDTAGQITPLAERIAAAKKAREALDTNKGEVYTPDMVVKKGITHPRVSEINMLLRPLSKAALLDVVADFMDLAYEEEWGAIEVREMLGPRLAIRNDSEPSSWARLGGEGA